MGKHLLKASQTRRGAGEDRGSGSEGGTEVGSKFCFLALNKVREDGGACRTEMQREKDNKALLITIWSLNSEATSRNFYCIHVPLRNVLQERHHNTPEELSASKFREKRNVALPR